MKTYTEMKQEHQKMVNNFDGIFFAFSNEQFENGLAKYGIKMEDAKEKICSIGSGGYLLKDRREDFRAMLDQISKNEKQFKKNEKELINGIVYEMNNHEYCITGDIQEALDVFDLKYCELEKSFIKKIMKAYYKTHSE